MDGGAWQCNITIYRPTTLSLRFTCRTESRNLSAAELYVHLPSRCWSNRLFQACFPIFSLSGTRCHKQFRSATVTVFMPRLLGGSLSDDAIWRLSVWSLSRTSGLSREQRPRKTKIITEVAHITRDSDTTFKVKGQGQRGRGILRWPPAQLVNA